MKGRSNIITKLPAMAMARYKTDRILLAVVKSSLSRANGIET